jgi:hypothetical protein
MSLGQIARRESGTHGRIIDTCPTEWGQWMIGFLDRAFRLPAVVGPGRRLPPDRLQHGSFTIDANRDRRDDSRLVCRCCLPRIPQRLWRRVIKGEIIDDRITLATDHAEPNVRLDLHNVGSSEPSSHICQQIDDAFLREIDAVTG